MGKEVLIQEYLRRRNTWGPRTRERTDIYTWFDLLDVDEERDVPLRTDTPDWAKASH